MSSEQVLAGQTAAISGGAGDIPGEIALELARRGADISLGDIADESSASELMAKITALGRRVYFHQVDVTDTEGVRAWFAATEAQLAPASLAIITAAVVTFQNVRNISPESWDREIQVNLNGAFRVAQTAALTMLQHKIKGRIVFIGSWVGHAPQTHVPAYCSSKAGLRMLMRCLAKDLAPDGILVNEVAPGNVDAGLTAKLFERIPSERDQSAKAIPVGSNSTPFDVAFQVGHLCDPRNAHMTGTALIMDGGLSLLSFPKATDWVE